MDHDDTLLRLLIGTGHATDDEAETELVMQHLWERGISDFRLWYVSHWGDPRYVLLLPAGSLAEASLIVLMFDVRIMATSGPLDRL